MAQQHRYPYQPLDPSIREIRVLHLTYPFEDADTPCVFNLAHASLDDIDSASEFSALSYTWGDPTNTVQIIIDNHPITITHNLHSALVRLQHDRSPSRIWIDAICINQSDTAEKNTQVPLMGLIYSRAELVIAWLGPGPYLGALGFLRNVGVQHREQICVVREAGQQQGAERVIVQVLQLLVAGDAPQGYMPTGVGRVLTVILRLFRKAAWWRRVWIVQEVVLARRAVFLCGDLREPAAPWDDVREAMVLLSYITRTLSKAPRHRAIYELLQVITTTPSPLWTLAEDFKESLQPPGNGSGSETEGPGLPLLDVLVATSIGLPDRIQTTDPRDRIYGLLGMVRGRDRARITVDYSSDMTREADGRGGKGSTR